MVSEMKGKSRSRLKLSKTEKRENCVSVRLNDTELEMLDEMRSKKKLRRGEYLRVSGLYSDLPADVPELNRKAWADLGRIGANLNQIAHNTNIGLDVDIKEIKAGLKALREVLLETKS